MIRKECLKIETLKIKWITFNPVKNKTTNVGILGPRAGIKKVH